MILTLMTKKITEIKKYSEKYKEIDKLLGDRDVLKTTDPDYKEVKEKLENLSNEIKTMQKEDLKDKQTNKLRPGYYLARSGLSST